MFFFFVVCQVLQSFSYLNFYSCILYVVSCSGLARTDQVSSLIIHPSQTIPHGFMVIIGTHIIEGCSLFSQVLQRPRPLAVILGISTHSIFLTESLRTDFRFHRQKKGCHPLLLNHPCFLSLISLLLSPWTWRQVP